MSQDWTPSGRIVPPPHIRPTLRAFEHHLEVSLVLNNAAISAISAGATAVTASTWQVGVER